MKFEEEIFPSILESIKKKYKEVFGEELELDADSLLENAYELDRPEHGLNFIEIIDNTSPYGCIDIVLGEPSEEEQEKYGVGEIIPCDSEYRDELLYASILLTKILIETGRFSINKELLFSEKGSYESLKDTFSSNIKEETYSEYVLLVENKKVLIPKNIVK